MKSLIFRLGLFIAIFLVYDKLYIILANRSAQAEIDRRLEYVINGEINKDLIILGSSIGSRDVIAGQIEKETGLSSYNLCYPGSNIIFSEFVLRTLLKFNETPSEILLVVDDDVEFLDHKPIVFRKDRLYPLIKYNYIWEELAKIEDRDIFLSRFLVINRLNKYNFDVRSKTFTPLDTIMDCGSMPISWQSEGRNWDYDSSCRDYPIGREVSERVSSFQNIVDMCEANDIILILVFPPHFRSHSKKFESRVRQLSGSKPYFYIYNEENPIYQMMEYYYDETHLIREGAVIFTSELSHYIENSVIQKMK
jgi:hypothetical protein